MSRHSSDVDLVLDSTVNIVSRNATTGVETAIDVNELTALNNIAAADLAKIDGITNGTAASGKALVLGASGEIATITTATITTANVTTLDTNVAAAGVTLSGTTLSADGTDANININITPKGTGDLITTALTVGAVGVASGVVTLAGTTSGTATLTVGDTGAAITSNVPISSAINGTLGATTPASAAVTTLTASGLATLDGNVMATEAAAGITGGTGTVYKSSVIKEGGIIRTSILLDLTGLGSSTTDLDIIGQGVSAAYLGQITAARNGTILTGRITCLEAPAGGVTDIDLYSATENTGVFDGLVTDLTETALLTSGAAWTLGRMVPIGAVPAANEYLYLTCGAAGTPGTYTAGKFLIELEGYVA